MIHEISSLLTKYYINAYLNHSKVFQDKNDLNEVSETTGKTLNEIQNILEALLKKETINLLALHKRLHEFDFGAKQLINEFLIV